MARTEKCGIIFHIFKNYFYGFPRLNTDQEIREEWLDNPDFFGGGMAQDAAIKMSADIDILLEEVSMLQKMLKETEWGGCTYEWDGRPRACCPLCKGIEPSDDIKPNPKYDSFIGHIKDCGYQSLNKRKPQVFFLGICYSVIMKYSKKRVEAAYEELCDCVEGEVRRLARKVLQENSRLTEFIKGMGTCFFKDVDGNSLGIDCCEHPNYTPKEIQEVFDLINEWDDILKLTGDPVRFTADGPEITCW